jgi:hypothetical protein
LGQAVELGTDFLLGDRVLSVGKTRPQMGIGFFGRGVL